MENLQIMEILFPNLATKITIVFTTSFIIYNILLLCTKIFHFPKLIITIVNAASSFIYEIFIMSFISFFLKRGHCHNYDRDGSDTSNDSFFNTGYMIGFDKVACNATYEHFALFYVTSMLGAVGFSACFGSYYLSYVKNVSMLERLL